jgi:putative transposase
MPLHKAIKGILTQTITQHYLVYQIRNICKFVVWSDLKEFCKALKKVYMAINIKISLAELENFKIKLAGQYKYTQQ